MKSILKIGVVGLALILFGCDEKEEGNKTLVGKWAFVERDEVTLEISESKIMLLSVVENSTRMETRTYSWVSSDTIEVTQQGFGVYVTRNKVIFHTPNNVTIEKWFIGNNYVDAPIYADVTIVRIVE